LIGNGGFGQLPRAQAAPQNDERRVVVTVRLEAARGTAMPPFVKRLRDDRTASGTRLRSATRVNCDDMLSSFFRFESKAPKEYTPRSVTDRLREIPVHHARDREVFVNNKIETRKDVTRELTRTVETLVANAFVHACNETFGFLPTMRPAMFA
jgi:hypothetical protein